MLCLIVTPSLEPAGLLREACSLLGAWGVLGQGAENTMSDPVLAEPSSSPLGNLAGLEANM